jgi:hypothetical protein
MQRELFRGSFLWFCTRPVPVRWRRAMRARFEVEDMRKLVDRRYLEHKILPWLARESGPHLLSIGCRAYTVHYEAMLKRRGATLSTADIDPTASCYGAKRHLVKSVTELTSSDFPTPVDGILFNGVIGWGLDDPNDIEAAFAAMAALLRPQSLLVVGWNTDRSADPIATVQSAASLFTSCPGPTGVERVTFPVSTHVYDFLRRR